MGALLALPFMVGTDEADLREARVRAEVRGEADPRLHVMMIDALEDAAAALNDRDCPLGHTYHAVVLAGDDDNRGIAQGVLDLIKHASEIDTGEEKIEELKKEHASEIADHEARYDRMVDERNAWQDKAHEAREAANAEDAKVRELAEKNRDQARSLKLLACVVLKCAFEKADEDAAIALARSILGIEEPAKPRRRVRKVKP